MLQVKVWLTLDLFLSNQIEAFDPFSILGLAPGVTESAIKKAYRRLSIQYHPDKNPDPGERCYWDAVYVSLYL